MSGRKEIKEQTLQDRAVEAEREVIREPSRPPFAARTALVDRDVVKLIDQVRLDILGWLSEHSEWHRDDLRIPLAAADKNVLGAVVNGLIRSGRIVETGGRRKSSDPASHGRKSNVYRLRDSGRDLHRSGRGVRGESTGLKSVRPNVEPVDTGQGPGEAPARTGGSQVEKKTPVASSSGSPDAGDAVSPAKLGGLDEAPGMAVEKPLQESGRAGGDDVTLPAPRLFDVESSTNYYRDEAA